MPVALACLDMHDVADADLALFLLRGDHTPAGCDHQDLVTVMGMPSGGGAFAKVYHVATKVIGLSVTDDRLPCAADRSSSPSGSRRSAVHGTFRQVTNLEYTHISPPFFLLSLLPYFPTVCPTRITSLPEIWESHRLYWLRINFSLQLIYEPRLPDLL